MIVIFWRLTSDGTAELVTFLNRILASLGYTNCQPKIQGIKKLKQLTRQRSGTGKFDEENAKMIFDETDQTTGQEHVGFLNSNHVKGVPCALILQNGITPEDSEKAINVKEISAVFEVKALSRKVLAPTHKLIYTSPKGNFACYTTSQEAAPRVIARVFDKVSRESQVTFTRTKGASMKASACHQTLQEQPCSVGVTASSSATADESSAEAALAASQTVEALMAVTRPTLVEDILDSVVLEVSECCELKDSFENKSPVRPESDKLNDNECDSDEGTHSDDAECFMSCLTVHKAPPRGQPCHIISSKKISTSHSVNFPSTEDILCKNKSRIVSFLFEDEVDLLRNESSHIMVQLLKLETNIPEVTLCLDTCGYPISFTKRKGDFGYNILHKNRSAMVFMKERKFKVGDKAKMSNESQVLRQLKLAGEIINLLGTYSDTQIEYVVLERPLCAISDILLHQTDGISKSDAYYVLVCILLGLFRIHNSWIHTNIKPDNIYITSGCQVKVGGFDRVVSLREIGQSEISGFQQKGFCPYSAPELQSHGIISTSADFFSVAVLLYELLTGNLPWKSNIEKMSHLNSNMSKSCLSFGSDYGDFLSRILIADPVERQRRCQMGRLQRMRLFRGKTFWEAMVHGPLLPPCGFVTLVRACLAK